ncbi:sugar phosphate nucleotidyltransferase [Ekhidna sp.]|jgi:glucose-1-phosphate thymidylyltransferase|uniref:sugar phosphate nucleotidyltransferase n=1 Tax=Ekhidna sp. TaxID=2608089 RepID=UPI0032ED0C76
MNLIIPMAGKGKRLRPHTLTTPKPLIPIAGKPIVQRLVEDIAKVTPEKIEKIGFVIGDFDEEIKDKLRGVAKEVGAEAHFFVQETAEGTAHAIACANEILEGKVTVAFSDTLFRANFKLNPEDDGIIWTKQIEDPSAFGVVKTNEAGVITDFIEKPKNFVSDQAIIGIYYFKKGEDLRKEIDYLIRNNIRGGGEFQLTMALENLKNKGTNFTIGTVDDWLDCGNKEITVQSNSQYLGFLNGENLVSNDARLENCEIIEPVYVGEGTEISNSKIGPNVSIGNNCKISNSRLSESLIQNNTTLDDVDLTNSMIGNFVNLKGQPKSVSLGDYSEW